MYNLKYDFNLEPYESHIKLLNILTQALKRMKSVITCHNIKCNTMKMKSTLV